MDTNQAAVSEAIRHGTLEKVAKSTEITKAGHSVQFAFVCVYFYVLSRT